MGKRLSIAVVADDLTGACDCGAQFAKAHYRTVVHFSEAWSSIPDCTDAFVVDVESRHLPARLAYQKAYEVGVRVNHAWLVYKKVDSALRGSIAEESAAVLEASGRRNAILAPAFPSQGRTTSGGVHLIHGKPVDQTEFALDPSSVQESHLPSLLKKAGLGPVIALSVQDLSDPIRVHYALENYGWIIADAQTDLDLEDLVSAVPDPEEVLWVGSAGLAWALGRRYPGDGDSPDAHLSSASLRAMAIIGSSSRAARRQIDYALQQPGVASAAFPIPAIKQKPDPTLIQESLAEARAGLTSGKHVIIFPVERSNSGREDVSSPDQEKSGLIVSSLAEIAARLAEEGLFDVLILSGGETAIHVARRLGVWGIRLMGELEPGVPFGTLLGSTPFTAVTKAGSFGQDETLFYCIHAFTERGGVCRAS